MATQRRKRQRSVQSTAFSKIAEYKEYKGISEVLLDEPKERAALIMLGMLRLSGLASPAFIPEEEEP